MLTNCKLMLTSCKLMESSNWLTVYQIVNWNFQSVFRYWHNAMWFIHLRDQVKYGYPWIMKCIRYMFAITVLCRYIYILLQTSKKQIYSLVLAFPCNCCRAAFGFLKVVFVICPSVEMGHPRNGSSPCVCLEPHSDNSHISLPFFFL